MKKEILACIKEENIKFLHSGQISKYIFPMERSLAHEKNITHLITRFFVISISPEGEILYLVQKRSKNKSSFPGYFTDSSSGHVLWAKNLNLISIKKDALRELEEEFGIPSKTIQEIRFYELSEEEDNGTKEISYIFFGLVDYRTPLNPDPKELDFEHSKFYTKEELENLLKNEKLVDHSEEIWRYILNYDINSLFREKIKQKDSRKNTALFIGRFQPLHHGHIYVLRSILKTYNNVKIGIGSSQLANTFNDPFTNRERNEFIKAVFKKRQLSPKRYEIYEIPDIFDAKNWVDHVVSIVGDFNAIFSNSDWIRELFLKKGFTLGKKYAIFKRKFNASNIRRLIVKDDKTWKSLVPQEVIKLMEEFDGINRIKSLS
ncbi:MAG: nicotinamide-nucleotide adenylyltransferase [Candidatus Lokiarchaeota archaeon]|nr:nicotinamide-nucleotide adenylyltransferase [Candidatus Lokiarchaeota archaeon]